MQPSTVSIWAKNVFHVVGTDASGQIIQTVRFRRETVLAFFARAAPAIVGMEACPGTHGSHASSGRGTLRSGRSCQFVKPYVKSNKNDTIDAATIAEAVSRPTMLLEEIKTPDQVDIQALHRIRDQMVRNRTRLICQMRAFCPQHGVAMRQGAGAFKLDLPRVIADVENDLTSTMRRLLDDLFEDLKRSEQRSRNHSAGLVS